MKKIIVSISLILLSLTSLPVAFAQGTKTIIPEITSEQVKSNYDCFALMNDFEEVFFFKIENEPAFTNSGDIKRFAESIKYLNKSEDYQWTEIGDNDILGCSITTGKIRLAYLPLLLRYVLEWLTILSGTVSMLFIIIGGYKYIAGAITEDKDSGKKTIQYAILGLIVSTAAWIIVNIVQTLVS